MTTAPPASYLPQRPFDVAEQIGFCLEPRRKAHQRVADPQLSPLFRLQPGMRRRRRVRDKAFRIPEVVRNIDEPQSVEKTKTARLIACNLETDRAPALLHLSPCEF